VVAAILGDTVNYAIGHYLGPKVFHYEKSRFFNPDHLRKTHTFYEKYGGKTIVIARFVPIVRTFAPFVAGIGAMDYRRFLAYNVVGGILWVAVCLFAGYFFGNLPFVKRNFSLVILAIIVISVLPAVYEYLRHRADQGGGLGLSEVRLASPHEWSDLVHGRGPNDTEPQPAPDEPGRGGPCAGARSRGPVRGGAFDPGRNGC
jgi:hypothetical protein